MASEAGQVRVTREERIRIGPISLFTLIAVISLAVLAVLAFSTANASYTFSQRQASSIAAVYLNESAGQELVAGIDDELSKGGSANLQAALPMIAAAAENAVDGRVTVSAKMVDNVVYAEITNENNRVLTIEVTIRDNGTYRIDKWKVTAIQNEEEPQGSLLIVG